MLQSAKVGKILVTEGATLMNGISALINETPERSFALFYHCGHSKKMTVYEPESGFSPNTESSGTLLLDFSPFRIVRNKFLSFIHRLVYGVQLQQPEWISTHLLVAPL